MADNFQNREDLLKKQFAESRRALGAEKNRALEQSKQDFNRFAAINRVQGGALLKAKNRQEQELTSRLGEVESGLNAQEALAQQQIQAEKGQQEFATKERLGSQEFAASEAEKTRGMQQQQLDEMKRQWNLEFEENLKTNMINAAIALRDANLSNWRGWRDLLGPSGAIGTIYGNRAPNIALPQTEVQRQQKQSEGMVWNPMKGTYVPAGTYNPPRMLLR